jgi:hypothetical protein
MLNTDGDRGLRPVPAQRSGGTAAGPGADPTGPGTDGIRADHVVRTDRKLGQLVHRRPPGITANQWNSATRTHLDFVVCDALSDTPVFAVEFDDSVRPDAENQRIGRMKKAVCDAVGLELLTIQSSTLRPDRHGRGIVDYLIDARAFRDAVTGDDPVGDDASGDDPAGAAPGYRDIVGRLPDGRTGFVNDLGAVARAAAVDAYVDRRLVDPILRGLHACWRDGPAEGWGWVEARAGRCLFERVRVWSHRFSCGVDSGRLAEDLAAAAIGERLLSIDSDAEPVLRDKAELGRELASLKLRRDELANEFAFDHVVLD